MGIIQRQIQNYHDCDSFWEYVYVFLVPSPICRAWRYVSLWILHPKNAYWRYKKNKWCRNVKVGDIVCDCRGRHVKVAQRDDYDDITTEDGFGCSLWHCCSPVMEDKSCHGISTDIFNWYTDNGIPIPVSLYKYFWPQEDVASYTFGMEWNDKA